MGKPRTRSFTVPQVPMKIYRQLAPAAKRAGFRTIGPWVLSVVQEHLAREWQRRHEEIRNKPAQPRAPIDQRTDEIEAWAILKEPAAPPVIDLDTDPELRAALETLGIAGAFRQAHADAKHVEEEAARRAQERAQEFAWLTEDIGFGPGERDASEDSDLFHAAVRQVEAEAAGIAPPLLAALSGMLESPADSMTPQELWGEDATGEPIEPSYDPQVHEPQVHPLVVPVVYLN